MRKKTNKNLNINLNLNLDVDHNFKNTCFFIKKIQKVTRKMSNNCHFYKFFFGSLVRYVRSAYLRCPNSPLNTTPPLSILPFSPSIHVRASDSNPVLTMSLLFFISLTAVIINRVDAIDSFVHLSVSLDRNCDLLLPSFA